jgi:competence protein ComEA
MGLLATGVLFVVARRPPGSPVRLLPPPTQAPVRAYVLGAVQSPGVYPLPRGSIVQDALNAAGGPTRNADVSQLNLAQVVKDGDRIDVPEVPPTAPPTLTPVPTVTVGPGTPSPTPADTPTSPPVPTTSRTQAASGAKININTATLAELDQLPRIGPAIAQRIIDYRTTNGPFGRIEDIMNVRGIGPATFDQIKDLITVGP